MAKEKSNHADNKLMPNGENENFERKGNLSQEKQIISSHTFNRQDKFRNNEDITFMIKDLKSKDGEGLLHCLEDQHAKSEQELWRDLLSNGNFRLKPCNINVYIFDNVQKHPARLGNILWSWLVEEIWRIRTFSNYPQNAAKSAILLASDGFAYMGSGRDVDDSVICFFCESVKNKWQPLDDICEVHKQLSPNCSMVTHINCPNIPLKTNHDSSLFDKVFQIQKYCRNLNASENSIGIQDIEHDGEITATNRSNLPVSSQAIPEHPRSIAAPPSQSRRADDSSQSLSSASPSVRESPSSAVSSITTAVSNNATTTSGNRVLTTANNLVSDSSLVTGSASSTDTEVPSTNTAAPSTDTAAGHSSAAASTSNTVNQAVANSSQNATKGNAGGPTYSELGIVTERPKRFEYAVLLKRIETFLSWPRDHHLRPKELAEAGFYYAGYGDCARCFHCGGGLRNWEDEDDVWVEHARWFPKCAYIRQQMGQVFVDIVQELNKTNDHIPFKMVMEKIGDAASTFQLDSKDNPLKRDPAVKTIVDMGFPNAEVIAKAEAIKDDGNILSADKIYEKLVADNVKKSSSGLNISGATSSGKIPAAVVAKDIGYEDCARCFYCGGGLRNWDDKDDVWVEHARRFPKCANVRQKMGHVFVDIVQELNKTNDHITFKMVSEKMCAAALASKVDNSLNYDHVIQQLVLMGFPKSEVTAMDKAITVHGLKVLLTQGYELKYIYQMFVKYKINGKPSTNQLNHLERPLHSSYTHVRTRLNTLQQYDDDPIRNKDIAKAGYFYKCEKKHLICHWCGKKIRALGRQENPFFEHARLVYDCGYINQLMGNFFVYFVKEAEINDDAASGIPDSAYPTSFSHEANTLEKTCPNYREQKSKGRIKARTSPENDEEDELDQELMRLVPCTVLDNPQFSSTRSRRISFHGTVYEPLKHLLAKAGFFYDVSIGSMKCFCCGGEVKHFPGNVNIFIYHAQTFHKCSYIMLAKDLYNSSLTSSNVDTGSTVQDESNTDIKQLSPEMLCKFCYLQRRCICYFPCHHVICCIDCGFGVTTCQICESQVTFIKYVRWSPQTN
ncbi:baculoviral IAP repeat-containing protein 2-like isoform X1 [Biomphalaria pfeifferi]|uniref:Baculoviral IAP repeat-containing protein 2-like isoform X1 n=1 Tax=Biomphalaria pfeifferi TaxID=112525 RepID=A0AAD8EYQ9_BIOPF|nr:baculoviral IAP repeat-containing protein 2-like isoform X1 [Biomphalaria pfeifferi]